MDDSFALTRAQAAQATRATRRIEVNAVAAPDWHNARAHLLLELDERLRAAPGDAARERLLAALQADLASDEAVSGLKDRHDPHLEPAL
jgi:metallo-beta-lactamase family protein